MSPMRSLRYGHGCALIEKNGVSTVIVVGGKGRKFHQLLSVLLATNDVVVVAANGYYMNAETLSLPSYADIATATWTGLGHVLPDGRTAFPLVSLGHQLYILGGVNGERTRDDTVLVSSDGGEHWELLPGRLGTPRDEHTAVSMGTWC